MNKKLLSNIFLLIGILNVFISLYLVIDVVNSADIIGGADIATFVFVLIYSCNGAYMTILLGGFLAVVVSFLMRLSQKKQFE